MATLRFDMDAAIYTTDVAELTRWPAADGQPYVVIEVRSLCDLRVRYLAVRTFNSGEHVISRHRSRRAAEQACRKHSRTLALIMGNGPRRRVSSKEQSAFLEYCMSRRLDPVAKKICLERWAGKTVNR
jgi:hypothetical protein